MYHLVFPAKYRRKVFSKAVEISLRDVYLEIGKRYENILLRSGWKSLMSTTQQIVQSG